MITATWSGDPQQPEFSVLAVPDKEDRSVGRPAQVVTAGQVADGACLLVEHLDAGRAIG